LITNFRLRFSYNFPENLGLGKQAVAENERVRILFGATAIFIHYLPKVFGQALEFFPLHLAAYSIWDFVSLGIGSLEKFDTKLEGSGFMTVK
jgi:hypothetical protein